MNDNLWVFSGIKVYYSKAFWVLWVLRKTESSSQLETKIVLSWVSLPCLSSWRKGT